MIMQAPYGKQKEERAEQVIATGVRPEGQGGENPQASIFAHCSTTESTDDFCRCAVQRKSGDMTPRASHTLRHKGELEITVWHLNYDKCHN